MISPILSVIDIDRSITFYTKTLGFSEKWKLEDNDGETNFACVNLGDAEILLGTIDFVSEADLPNRGIGIQLYVEVPEEIPISEMYQNAKDNQVNITKPLSKRDWGETVFVINDIDGYNLMFAQS